MSSACTTMPVCRFLSNSKQVASRWLYLVVALVLIAVDQFTKNLAIAALKPGIGYPVIGEVLSWRLIYNDSAAFSLGFGQTWILAVIAAAATLAMSVLSADRMLAVAWYFVATLEDVIDPAEIK